MKIIVITGIDGAGKTTLQKQLLAYIDNYELGKAADMHLPHSSFVDQALSISGGGRPFGDTYTDRLIFAADNHLAAYRIRELSRTHDFLVMQRGWMDSFIHGAVQGYTYQQMAALNQIRDLPSSACTIYLNCQPDVAYNRIQDDPLKDKFETLAYLERQYAEVRRFYGHLDNASLLTHLFPEQRTYIDTTDMAPREVLAETLDFLKKDIFNKNITIRQEVLL